MDGLNQFLVWVDSDPARYWAIAWTALGVATILSVANELPWLLDLKPAPTARAWRALNSRWLYVAAVALVFTTFRWAAWATPEYSNPDESQMIAGAITLRQDPVFWRSVDGTTHGPLDDYVLLLPTLFGAPLGFASARFLGTLLQFACLAGVWAAARRLLSDTSARIGLLPAIAWMASIGHFDFYQYNSDMLPLALLGLAGAAAVSALANDRPRQRIILFGIAGALLGAVPFAKLQGIPIAITLTLLTVASAAWQAIDRTRGDFLRTMVAFAAGLLLPATLFAVMLVSHGLVGEFWQTYIRNNFMYATEYRISWRAAFEGLPGYMRTVTSYAEIFLGHVVALALLLATSALGAVRTRWVVGAAWLIFASSLVAVVTPGRQFVHYLQFLIPALGLLLAAQYHGTREFFATAPVRLRCLPLVVVLAAALSPVIYYRSIEPIYTIGRYRERPNLQLAPAAFVIHRDAAPGDRLAMWGWQPNLFVETGLPQGTRDAHTAFLIRDGPLRDYYRARYLADFRHNNPAWFVDAVGPGRFCYEDRKLYGYETFPELATLVQSNFVFVADVEGYRIYRRK